MPSASAAASSAITTRKDLERWRHRVKTRRRFLLTAYLIGAIPSYLIAICIGIYSFSQSSHNLTFGEMAFRLLFALIPSFCCMGPFILLPCWMVLAGGLGSYQESMKELRDQHRVCEVCEAVALYDDKYVYPSKRKGHTKADLIPHMNLIKEAGVTHMLCDACLADMSASDAGG